MKNYLSIAASLLVAMPAMAGSYTVPAGAADPTAAFAAATPLGSYNRVELTAVPDGWTLLGTGHLTDGAISGFLEQTPAEWDVKVLQSNENPKVYALLNPWTDGCPWNADGAYTADENADCLLQFNCEDEDYVYLYPGGGAGSGDTYFATNVEDRGYGELFFNSRYGGTCGILQDNKIIFDREDAEHQVPIFLKSESNNKHRVPSAFIVELPEQGFKVTVEGSCFENNIAKGKVSGAGDYIVKYMIYPGQMDNATQAQNSVKFLGKTLEGDEFEIEANKFNGQTIPNAWVTLWVMAFEKDAIGQAGALKESFYKFVYNHQIAHNDDEWTLLGTGKYTDDLVGEDEIEPYKVDVYESKTTKGLYHVYNLYANHPYVANGTYKASNHDHYVEIDATNPAAVTIKESVVGVEIDGYDLFLSSNGAGTLSEDGVITFPQSALKIFTDTNKAANNHGRFALQLPGFGEPDYTFEATNTGFCTDDNVLKFTIKKGEDVAKVKWYWVNGYYFDGNDKNFDTVEPFVTEELPDQEVNTLDLKEKTGWSTLYLLAYDAEGNRVGGAALWNYTTPAMVDSEWTLLGTGKFTDDTFLYNFNNNDEIEPYEVTVYENVKSAGLYRIVDPYKNHPYVLNGAVEYHGDHHHYLDINTTGGKSNVIIPAAPTGLKVEGHDHALLSFYEGKIDDNGVVTFPEKGLTNLYENGEYQGNFNGRFKIEIPIKDKPQEPVVEIPEYEVAISAKDICFEDGVVELKVQQGSCIQEMWIFNLSGRKDATPSYMMPSLVDAIGTKVTPGTYIQQAPMAGWSTFFVVGSDEYGDLVDIKCVKVYNDVFSDYDWEAIGEGKIVDSTYGTATGLSDKEQSYTVKVYESYDNRGTYRFEDPFANHPVVDKATFHSHVHYIEVDATGVTNGEPYATIDFQPTGAKHEGEDVVIRSRRGGSVAGGVITFSGSGIEYSAGKNVYTPTADSKISFVLPTSGIESVETEAGVAAPEVIFDLSGRRINKINAKGLYIVNGQKVVR